VKDDVAISDVADFFRILEAVKNKKLSVAIIKNVDWQLRMLLEDNRGPKVCERSIDGLTC
jgi:hypothetical protein